MADFRLILIAEDPKFVPDVEQLELAREFLAELAGDAEEVFTTNSGEVEFYDCGHSFEEVRCPACGRELFLDWWQEQMDAAYQQQSPLRKIALPCCNARRTLHELRYDAAQGFGAFSLQARNPDISDLDDDAKGELEQIVGTKLRVIWNRG